MRICRAGRGNSEVKRNNLKPHAVGLWVSVWLIRSDVNVVWHREDWSLWEVKRRLGRSPAARSSEADDTGRFVRSNVFNVLWIIGCSRPGHRLILLRCNERNWETNKSGFTINVSSQSFVTFRRDTQFHKLRKQ